MSLLDFSPRIPLGTFSILLLISDANNLIKHPIFLLYQLELSYTERYGSDSIIVLYII